MPSTAPIDAPIDVYFVLPRGSLILDWAGPAEALRFANTELPAKQPAFTLHFAAPQPESQSSVGAMITGLATLPEVIAAPARVLRVGRTSTAQRRDDDREDRLVFEWLRRVRPGRDDVRLVTVCSGALLAASAGLFSRRRATTHHGDLDELACRAPDAIVVPDRVFVQDGETWSSAGVTAGIGLALHLVAEQCGPVVAARVAQRMAVALRRGPDDPQLSPFLAHRHHFNARLFGEHTGTTPLAYLRGIRLALARTALEAGSTVTAAAEAAGFHSDLQLRRAWLSAGLSGSPGALRGTG